MRILLSFVPFFAFGFILGAVPIAVACLIAAGLSLAITLGDRLLRGRSIKLLDVGTVLIFGALALIAATLYPALSPSWVWVAVDAGLLLIALVSLVMRRPFTIQYAREQITRDLWNSPAFMAANVRITAAWTAAFAGCYLPSWRAFTSPAFPAGPTRRPRSSPLSPPCDSPAGIRPISSGCDQPPSAADSATPRFHTSTRYR